LTSSGRLVGNVTYGGSFNGSNQYLSVSSGATSIGTGDFTFECYINPTTWPTYSPIIIADAVGGFYVGKNGSNFVLRAASSADLIVTSTLPTTSQWTHVAVTRSGTTAYIFFNGKLITSGTTGQNFATGTTYIGWDGGTSYLNAYVSNLRVIKGTALYTANFTPPTANLTAVTNTSLLTLQNATIIDNSTNAYTITNNNSVTTSVVAPFGLN